MLVNILYVQYHCWILECLCALPRSLCFSGQQVSWVYVVCVWRWQTQRWISLTGERHSWSFEKELPKLLQLLMTIVLSYFWPEIYTRFLIWLGSSFRIWGISKWIQPCALLIIYFHIWYSCSFCPDHVPAGKSCKQCPGQTFWLSWWPHFSVYI